MAEAGLPPTKFGLTAFFTATFERPKPPKSVDLGETFSANFRINFRIKLEIKGKRLERIVSLLGLASKEALPKGEELAAQFRVSSRLIYGDLRFLREKGLLMLEGSRKTGSYVLTGKGKALLKELGR